MVIIKSITSFPVLTLPSSNLIWKPSNLWTAKEKKIYLVHRNKIKQSIIKSRVYSSGSEKTLENQKSQYLLIDGSKILAWAEIQPFIKSFRSAVIIWDTIDAQEAHEVFKTLNPVISSSFVILQTDLLRVISLVPTDSIYADIDERTLWSLSKNPIGLTQYKCFDIRKEAWIQTHPLGKEMTALKARIERLKFESRNQKAPSQLRRGILARLFRPKIDDALF